MPLDTVSYGPMVVGTLDKLGLDYTPLDGCMLDSRIVSSWYFYVVSSKDQSKFIQLFSAFPNTKTSYPQASALRMIIGNVTLLVITDYEVYLRSLSALSGVVSLVSSLGQVGNMHKLARDAFYVVFDAMDDMYAYLLSIKKDDQIPTEELIE